MVIADGSYAAELDAATQRIKRLKDRYEWRRRSCGGNATGSANAKAEENGSDAAKGSEEPAGPPKDSSALRVLVAKCLLLEPDLQNGAVDAANLHKKVRVTWVCRCAAVAWCLSLQCLAFLNTHRQELLAVKCC